VCTWRLASELASAWNHSDSWNYWSSRPSTKQKIPGSNPAIFRNWYVAVLFSQLNTYICTGIVCTWEICIGKWFLKYFKKRKKRNIDLHGVDCLCEKQLKICFLAILCQPVAWLKFSGNYTRATTARSHHCAFVAKQCDQKCCEKATKMFQKLPNIEQHFFIFCLQDPSKLLKIYKKYMKTKSF
jgi:hypothetical protein